MRYRQREAAGGSGHIKPRIAGAAEFRGSLIDPGTGATARATRADHSRRGAPEPIAQASGHPVCDFSGSAALAAVG